MSSVVRLGDVADVVSGIGFPKEMQGQAEGEVPVFKVGDISNAVKSGDRYLRSSPNYLSNEAARGLTKNLMPAGTTVFAKIGEGLKLNRRAILAQPSLVDNNVMGLVPNTVVATSAYLYYFMQTVDLGELSQATAIPSVRKSDVIEIRIPLPPLQLQECIVAEIEKQFSRLDQAVASLRRVKAQLKRYRASVLKAGVEGWLVETEAERARCEGRGFETGAELLQRILETRRSQWKGKGKYKEPAAPETSGLPELPEGWCWSSTDQLAEVGTGATPNRSNATFFDGGDIPWVTSAVVNEPFVDKASELVTRAALLQTNLTLYPLGTLLVAMYGEGKTRGKCSELRITAATNQALAAVQADPSVRSYLKMFLEHNYEETRKAASGGVQPNLNLSLVRAIRVPLPPLPEQHRIVAEVDRRLSIVREVESEVDANLKRAQALRQAVLARAFTAAPDARYTGA